MPARTARSRQKATSTINGTEQIRQTLLVKALKLTSTQRLRIIQKLYQRKAWEMMSDLEEVYEDIRAWNAPGEVMTGIIDTCERNLRDTVEFWFEVLFPDKETRSAEVYGAHYLAAKRVPGYFLARYKQPPFHDIIEYLKFSCYDGIIRFVVDAEESMIINKSDWGNISRTYDRMQELQDEVYKLREALSEKEDILTQLTQDLKQEKYAQG